MKASIDGRRAAKVLNDCKVVFASGEALDLERHVTVTPEGVIVDLVNDSGEVVATRSMTHDELLPEDDS
jgi:hypothetical protein